MFLLVNNTSKKQSLKNFSGNLKFQGAGYSVHVVNFNFQGPWCYSDQDVGVIEPRNFDVTATPCKFLLVKNTSKNDPSNNDF